MPHAFADDGELNHFDIATNDIILGRSHGVIYHMVIC